VTSSAHALRARIIPIVRAETLIPYGEYCTTSDNDRASTSSRFARRCPFWQLRPASGSGYCAYLRRGDEEVPGARHLRDGVKACGIKTEDWR
jgi:hypothetical protein